MNLFQKGLSEIHGRKDHALSSDLFLALNLMRKNGEGNITLAIGEHDDLIFSETKSEAAISMAVFDKKKKNLKGLRVNPITRQKSEDFSDENLQDCVTVMAIALRILNVSTTDFNQFEAKVGRPMSDDEMFELNSILQTIESEIVRKIFSREDETGLGAINRAIGEINMSLVETGILCPTKVIFGQFEGFKTTERTRPTVKLSEIKEKFVLNKERVLTPEEQGLMFNIPQYYSVSSNVLSIAEKVKASWDKDPNLRKVNILMEGPAGTGKTLDSKVLSRLLGLPYTKITCFSDMDSSDVTGAILPVANDEPNLPMPSDDELFFDPAGCYERLTGKEAPEDITEAEVRDVMNEAYENFYASQEGKNSPRYVYYASEIVKAFENGWLCEIQEPTCIADAAVLLVLNSALEKEGIINLAQRTVKRHPECIFVMTTNRDYEGCRPLNQALRDRFNITKKVQLPSHDEQVERLSAATGCADRDFLRETVNACNSLNEFLQSEGINANISLRGMQDFVADIMNGFDVRESVMEDLIYKISTDDEEVASMENFLDLSTRLFSVRMEAA